MILASVRKALWIAVTPIVVGIAVFLGRNTEFRRPV